ncbi:MAG: asparagine synthase (glutamine-hydrolyzing) [Coprococcus sp.]
MGFLGGMIHMKKDLSESSSDKNLGEKDIRVVYSGELIIVENYESWCEGKVFMTDDTEVVLNGSYTEWIFVKQMNGVFAFAFYDEKLGVLHLFRDRIGVKPLFYTRQGDTIFFASEIETLLANSGVKPVLDRKGLNEVFSIGPAKTYGCGVFKGIDEVLPGHLLSYTGAEMKNSCYWKLESKVHEDNYEQTVEKTAFLLENAVKNQMISGVPVCTFLSGGLDSSLVSAICARELRKEGKRLHTFSFDFVGNDKNFQANMFQPSQDRPYVEKMVTFLDSEHHYLECDSRTQADYLYASIDAKGLPAMADVDSSLLYFCSQVAKEYKVALTGECADEIFGGYPWFHKKECLEAHTFPWTMDLAPRGANAFRRIFKALKMDAYVQETGANPAAETPRLAGESALETRRREISGLNQKKWFMRTLLDRMGGTSARYGLSARVPFADYRIVEYLWNVPWEMQARQRGVRRGLLREVGRGIAPG